MANLYSPATITAAIKQEPPQSPPPLPPPEPIPQPISMATIIAAIKQEPHQSPPSLPPPGPIPQPISMATIIAAIKQELLQSLLSPPPPTPILPPSLSPPTPIPPPSQPLPTSIPPPSQPLPTPIPPLSQPLPTPIPQPSQSLPTPIPPPSQPLPKPLTVVKTEPEQPVQQQNQPPPQQPLQQQQQQKQESQFLNSINDLASLSKTLHAFNTKFEELTNHLVSINQAIDVKFNEPPPVHTNLASSSSSSPPQPPIQTQQPVSLKPTETETETPKSVSCPTPTRSSIQKFCHGMKAKCVRKYIVNNSSDIPKLREEIPEALKLAPEPAKLVLDCVGHFFLMGKKACTNDPNTISIKKALVLLLDIFASFRGRNRIKVALKVWVESEKLAIRWRHRLTVEGGLDKASEIDTRGLLLFIACFGIPRFFGNVDLGILFNSSNLKAVSDALKASPVLPCRIPDIIDAMVTNGMHFKAVEAASIFGLEDKFSPRTILNSLLPESIKEFEEKQKACNTPLALKRATKKHLATLRLIVRCMEDRSSDGTLLLDSWQMKEKIAKLEEEIAELSKQIKEKKRKRPKRKQDQMGSSTAVTSQETKRTRLETEGPPLPKSHVNQLCEQPTTVLAEGNGLVTNSLDANNSPAVSAAPHGSLNEIGQMEGTTGVGSSGTGVIPASSCSVEDREIEVDKTGKMMSGNGRWQQGCVPQSTSTWFAGLFGSSPPSLEGFVGVLDSTVWTSEDRYRFADSLA